MTIRLIRGIDKLIGIPLCAILTAHRTLDGKRQNPEDTGSNPKKILFIKLSEQGSTVISIPALQKAAALVGRENLYFLVFAQNRPILDIVGLILPGHIIEINDRGLLAMLCSIIKALRRIRTEKIDTGLDMEFFSRGSAIIAYLSGARARIGVHPARNRGPWRGDLLTKRLTYDPTRHTGLFFMDLVTAGGGAAATAASAPGRDFQFVPTTQEKEALADRIKRLKENAFKGPLIILNPNSADPLRIRAWAQSNFIELGNRIVRDTPEATVIITGTRKERSAAQRIAGHIPGAISLAGETSLRELLTLYCLAKVLVTSDSGPGHFASLTSIRAIILFGPETPALYGPNNKNTVILYHNRDCSPCLNAYNGRQSSCRDARCLSEIGADEVYRHLRKALSGNGDR